MLHPIMPAVRNHHERWDGSGYPDKMVAEAIPLSARIVAIADAYVRRDGDRPSVQEGPLPRGVRGHFSARPPARCTTPSSSRSSSRAASAPSIARTTTTCRTTTATPTPRPRPDLATQAARQPLLLRGGQIAPLDPGALHVYAMPLLLAFHGLTLESASSRAPRSAYRASSRPQAWGGPAAPRACLPMTIL